MTMSVERAGLLTTVQDGGRWGYQAQGVPVSGPMDAWSAAMANLLAGNPRDEALLEITVTGPVLRFDRPVRIGIAGAEFDVQVNARRLPVPGAADLVPGERLAFGARRRGCRAYLALYGGVRTPSVLGSRSTHVRTSLGGRPLRAGDSLPVGLSGGSDSGPLPVMRAAAPSTRLPRGGTTLRVLEGPDRHEGGGALWEHLIGTSFRLSPQSDRMGFRLDGPAGVTAPSGRLSIPTVTGAVQVPPDGRPILLMADRQTTGGYAVPAVVCQADLGLAAQLMPGDAVGFEPVSMEAAERARVVQERELMEWFHGGRP